IGNLKYDEGYYDEALDNYYKGLNETEKSGDKQLMVSLYYVIASSYYSQNNFKDAQENYLSSLKISQELNDTVTTAAAQMAIGRADLGEGDYNSAMQMQLEALQILKAKGHPTVIFAYEYIGNIYEKEGEVATAEGDRLESRKKFLLALDNYFSALKGMGKFQRK